MKILSIVGLLVLLATTRARAYMAHEWGTFTSVQGSDGKNQVGLWREEEVLPGFVQGRGACTNIKCADFVIRDEGPFAVNQKLETPVLYFYSKKAKSVSAEVSFPKGLITQYYPNASSFAPPLSNLVGMKQGMARWEVNISNEELPLPSVAAGNVYAPARETGANFISVGGENEKFIFYRGLGNFVLPFRVTSGPDDTVVLNNDSAEAVPAAFLVRFEGGRGEVLKTGPVRPGSPLEVKAPVVSGSSPEQGAYLAKANALLTQTLVESGLFKDEAVAMVETWKRSYFLSPGLKVLFVVPRHWTDELLPIKLMPAADSLVRTLVGRVEVLLASEEQRMLHLLKKAAAAQAPLPIAEFGRFADPKLRRILALNTSPQVEAYVKSEFSFTADR